MSQTSKFEGIVIKAYSGFFYVLVDGQLFECSLRGKFRLERANVLVGDRVQVSSTGKNRGVIDSVFPRTSELTRPSIANINQVVLACASKHPDFSCEMLDRFLVLIENCNLPVVICVNKVDVAEPEQLKKILDYLNFLGYKYILTSAKTGQGIAELKDVLKDKISVFAGQSGVGKSALVNCIQPGLKLKEGDISERLRRGKHTTRYAQLFHLDDGGLVADAPGFSFLSLEEIHKEDLPLCFPEMERQLGKCKFPRCLHISEPQCAIKSAVDAGEIHPIRYQNYVQFSKETGGNESW